MYLCSGSILCHSVIPFPIKRQMDMLYVGACEKGGHTDAPVPMRVHVWMTGVVPALA